MYWSVFFFFAYFFEYYQTPSLSWWFASCPSVSVHTQLPVNKLFICKYLRLKETNVKSNKLNWFSDVVAINEERTMNCPFSVIMVPVLCPSQVQYYDNWRLAVPSQYMLPFPQVTLTLPHCHVPMLLRFILWNSLKFLYIVFSIEMFDLLTLRMCFEAKD